LRITQLGCAFFINHIELQLLANYLTFSLICYTLLYITDITENVNSEKKFCMIIFSISMCFENTKSTPIEKDGNCIAQ